MYNMLTEHHADCTSVHAVMCSYLRNECYSMVDCSSLLDKGNCTALARLRSTLAREAPRVEKLSSRGCLNNVFV